MVISTGELLIVIGGTVEASVTLNMCDPSSAVSSMIDTIAHAMSSFTPGVNVISSGSAAEKSSPITINIRSKSVNWIFYTVMVKEDKCRRFDTVKTNPLSTMQDTCVQAYNLHTCLSTVNKSEGSNEGTAQST